jgi:hypothetical protein
MDERTEQETQPAGRSISVLAIGDNVTEVEMNALDEARKFFGGHWRLTIVPDYRVFPNDPGGSLAAKANGKQYHASVIVRIIEPS